MELYTSSKERSSMVSAVLTEIIDVNAPRPGLSASCSILSISCIRPQDWIFSPTYTHVYLKSYVARRQYVSGKGGKRKDKVSAAAAGIRISAQCYHLPNIRSQSTHSPDLSHSSITRHFYHHPHPVNQQPVNHYLIHQQNLFYLRQTVQNCVEAIEP